VIQSAAAWWGGIPCALESVRYYRARGLEPSISVVAMPRAYFRDSLAPEDVKEPFRKRDEPLPESAGMVHGWEPISFEPVARPPYVGDLVLLQGEVFKAPRIVRARQLYLVESRVADPRHSGDAIVELTLADIRRFWEDYGKAITREWNVGLPQTTSIVIPGSGVVDRDALTRRRYVAHTAREGGTQPTPLRSIVQELLDALPGSLKLARWPDEYLKGKEPPEVRCWGASPKRVLAALLDAYRLEIDIGPDLAPRVYGFGEGVVGEAYSTLRGEVVIAPHDPVSGKGAWEGSVTADGDRYARRPSHRPREVEVIGDRTVTEATVDYLTPVLFYEERGDDAPPRSVVVEATPDNLIAFARGNLSGGEDPGAEVPRLSEDDRARISLILGASDRNAVPISAGIPGVEPVGTAPDALGGVFWQMLVLADGTGWTESFPTLAEPVRDLLRRQLFRYYQVPERLRRLLPVLSRAERDYKGDRLPPKVEAFTYRRTSVRVLKPEFVPKGEEAKRLERQALLKKLDEVLKGIRELEARKERLRAPTLPEVALAIRSQFGRFAFSPTTKEERALDRFEEAWASVGRGWLRALRDGAREVKILGAESIAGFLDWVGADDGGLDSGQVERRLKEIDEGIAILREEELKIVGQLNPRGAVERRLGETEAAIRTATLLRGEAIPAKLSAQAADLRRELDALISKASAEDPPPDRSEQTEEIVFHVNLTRFEVPYRIVDEDLGIIELTGGLPGWLADPMVSDPRSTFFIPMPVRMTFGTFNGLDVAQRSGPPPPVNFYVARSVAMIASDPRLWPFVGRLGHRLPKEIGEEQVRFTFSQDDQESGKATISEHPWRIVFDDPENPLRLLVRLAGSNALTSAPDADADPGSDETVKPLDNRQELLERARPFAKAALAAPAEIDAGSLTVYGPRTVLLNGRLSAVAVIYQDGAWVTEASFGADAAPLPGEEGPVRQHGPTRLVFGLDVERNRNL